MNFRAKLRPNSAIHRDWIGAARVGGVISDVQFKRAGQDFVSVDDPLPGPAVSALLHHHMVDLEVSTAPVGSVVIVENDPEQEGSEDEAESEESEAIPAEDPDPLASLWRAKPEPKQDPVMRRRGRPPMNR